MNNFISKTKDLFKLCLPITIDLLLVFAIFIVDSMFLSYISDSIDGSIGSLFSIFGICAVLFRAIAQSGTILGSQYIGANNLDGARRVVSIAIFINFYLAYV